MHICIPIVEDRGLESPVSAHFGSAPWFMIVDTDTGHRRTVPNHPAHHGHGACQPLAALAGEPLDGLVVGGIGRRALARLQEASLRVFLADHATVDQTLAALREGTLAEATGETSCCQRHEHGPGHSCGHGGCQHE